MSKNVELATLRELDRIYQNCPERVATYTKRRWLATVTTWILIFIAFFLGSFASVSPRVSLVIALLGGFAGGLSVMFTSSANQMPLLVRYTTLRE